MLSTPTAFPNFGKPAVVKAVATVSPSDNAVTNKLKDLIAGFNAFTNLDLNKTVIPTNDSNAVSSGAFSNIPT